MNKATMEKPPQFAIWLEDRETEEIQTVFVTYRTATGDFIGKAECPVSLPVWIAVFRKETGRDDFPTKRNPASEAVTEATPKMKEFSLQIEIPDDLIGTITWKLMFLPIIQMISLL